jgi:hypothetical protein
MAGCVQKDQVGELEIELDDNRFIEHQLKGIVIKTINEETGDSYLSIINHTRNKLRRLQFRCRGGTATAQKQEKQSKRHRLTDNKPKQMSLPVDTATSVNRHTQPTVMPIIQRTIRQQKPSQAPPITTDKRHQHDSDARPQCLQVSSNQST